MMYPFPIMLKMNTCAVIALLIVLAGAPGLCFGQTDSSESVVNTRLQFEVALQALASHDPQLASAVLRGLFDSAELETPERQVYEAMVSFAEGQTSASGVALMEIFESNSPDTFTSPWVYDELVRRVATIRLATTKDHATAELKELLAQHYEARGGLDQLLALDDLVATGHIVFTDGEVPFRLYRKRPNFYRLDMATARGIHIMACDQQVAWRLDPTLNGGHPEFLSGAQAEQLKSQSPFDEVLVRYEETGEHLFPSGIEDLDGVKAYRIEINDRSGGRSRIYIDAESFLEIKRLIWTNAEGAPPVEMTYEYSLVDGLPLPVRQTITTATGSIEYRFDQYTLHQEINTRIFDSASIKVVEQKSEDG